MMIMALWWPSANRALTSRGVVGYIFCCCLRVFCGSNAFTCAFVAACTLEDLSYRTQGAAARDLETSGRTPGRQAATLSRFRPRRKRRKGPSTQDSSPRPRPLIEERNHLMVGAADAIVCLWWSLLLPHKIFINSTLLTPLFPHRLSV